jgi:hypothetical protein
MRTIDRRLRAADGEFDIRLVDELRGPHALRTEFPAELSAREPAEILVHEGNDLIDRAAVAFASGTEKAGDLSSPCCRCKLHERNPSFARESKLVRQTGSGQDRTRATFL